MKCEKAEQLMMKYMDNNISEYEKTMLDLHLPECPECKRAFEIYNEINFAGIKINAPDIEDEIMNKIYSLPVSKDNAFDIVCVALGILSAVIGIGVLKIDNVNIFINNAFITANNILTNYKDIIEPVLFRIFGILIFCWIYLLQCFSTSKNQ